MGTLVSPRAVLSPCIQASCRSVIGPCLKGVTQPWQGLGTESHTCFLLHVLL